MLKVTAHDRFDSKFKKDIIQCSTMDLAVGSARRFLSDYRADSEHFEYGSLCSNELLVEMVDVNNEASDIYCRIVKLASN